MSDAAAELSRPQVDWPQRGYLAVVGAICRDQQWPEPVAEYRFAPPRRWRFDLCWRDHGLAVEVQGALFSGGRHVRGAALVREFEKLNVAAVRGWTVLLVLPVQLTDGTLSRLLTDYFEGTGDRCR
jgi:hypothetical protein